MIADRSSSAGLTSTRHVDAIQQYVDAGYDHVYVHQVQARTRKGSSRPTPATCCRGSAERGLTHCGGPSAINVGAGYPCSRRRKPLRV